MTVNDGNIYKLNKLCNFRAKSSSQRDRNDAISLVSSAFGLRRIDIPIIFTPHNI